MFLPWKGALFDQDAYAREIVRLHCGPEGSAYGNDLAARGLNYRDVEHFDDLYDLLPLEEDSVVRDHDADYFVPKKLLKEEPSRLVYGESSGTTGPQKTIPWHAGTIGEVLQWMDWNFDKIGIPRKKDILYFGPTGLFQQGMDGIANRRGGKGIPVLSEASTLGEIKKSLSAGGGEREHVSKWIASRMFRAAKGEENIGTIITLGPVLEYLKEVGSVDEVEAFIVGGFGISADEYRALKKVYPDKVLQQSYGNIFWFWAFNQDDEQLNLNYYPQFPQFSFDIVDPKSGEPRKTGEDGQVTGLRLTPEMLLRWKERDAAVKIAGDRNYPWEGAKNVRALADYLKETQ